MSLRHSASDNTAMPSSLALSSFIPHRHPQSHSLSGQRHFLGKRYGLESYAAAPVVLGDHSGKPFQRGCRVYFGELIHFGRRERRSGRRLRNFLADPRSRAGRLVSHPINRRRRPSGGSWPRTTRSGRANPPSTGTSRTVRARSPAPLHRAAAAFQDPGEAEQSARLPG